jgi:NAD(P)-dependent dehydrogenase (short-subunit alcohol dehydrogenase family)
MRLEKRVALFGKLDILVNDAGAPRKFWRGPSPAA